MSNSFDFVKGQLFAYETVLGWLQDNGSDTVSAEKLSERLAFFVDQLKQEAVKRD